MPSARAEDFVAPLCDSVLNGAARLEVMSAGFIRMAARSRSQSMAVAKSGRLCFTKSSAKWA
jgi:hypothetical protein